MIRTARLLRTIRTEWGDFAPGVIVKVVAVEGDTAIVDFGLGTTTKDGHVLHMYSVIRSASIRTFDRNGVAAA